MDVFLMGLARTQPRIESMDFTAEHAENAERKTEGVQTSGPDEMQRSGPT